MGYCFVGMDELNKTLESIRGIHQRYRSWNNLIKQINNWL